MAGPTAGAALAAPATLWVVLFRAGQRRFAPDLPRTGPPEGPTTRLVRAGRTGPLVPAAHETAGVLVGGCATVLCSGRGADPAPISVRAGSPSVQDLRFWHTRSQTHRRALAALAGVSAVGGLCLVAVPAAGATDAACPGAVSSTDTSCTFTCTGGLQSLTVPAGVVGLDVVSVGAAGGAGDHGGAGGYSGLLNTDVVLVAAGAGGGGGFGQGGGAGDSGSGGGHGGDRGSGLGGTGAVGATPGGGGSGALGAAAGADGSAVPGGGGGASDGNSHSSGGGGGGYAGGGGGGGGNSGGGGGGGGSSYGITGLVDEKTTSDPAGVSVTFLFRASVTSVSPGAGPSGAGSPSRSPGGTSPGPRR